MGVFEEIQQALGELRASAGPSVVGIGNRRGFGSGVVVATGRVATNAHNVHGPEITVTFADGRSETGTVAGVDVDGDVAMVTVDTGDAPPIEWSGDGVAIGSPVFALSNPGGRGLRVSFGFVSGTERSFRGPRGRRITGSIEHTAPLLPGSSGGPVLDRGGRLAGINTNRLGEGFYLAIPADPSLRERLEALARGETPSRPRLGVGIAPPHVARGLRRAVGLPDADGVLVRHVEQDGPAHAAGVREGDLIVAAGGRAVADPDALAEAVSAANGSIELRILRGAEERAVTVTF